MGQPADDLPPLDPSADPSPLFAQVVHEQAAVEVRAKAHVIAAFYVQLRDEGVPEYEALELTREFQHDFLAPIREAREKLHEERERDEEDKGDLPEP